LTVVIQVLDAVMDRLKTGTSHRLDESSDITLLPDDVLYDHACTIRDTLQAAMAMSNLTSDSEVCVRVGAPLLPQAMCLFPYGCAGHAEGSVD
jgi:hypothetical protein